MRVLLLAALLASAPPSPPPLWNASGHRIVAFIVWDELSEGARAKLVEILKQHPRYEQDLLAGAPKDGDARAAERHAFAAAAVWPDVVRSLSHPLHATADHPPWHYVDIAFALEGQRVPPEPAAEQRGPRNVLEALPKCVADLADASLAPADRAIALCWVLHLVGDIHQPLHACSLYSPQFPNGDQGGNAFSVLREPRASAPTNLHHIWDALPGAFQAEELEGYLAAGMRADPKLSRAHEHVALANKGFPAWADESHALAVEFAYANGTLQGATARPAASQPSRAESRRQAPVLPAGYLEQAEKVALRRIVLAGYRCADLLEATLARR